MFCDLVGSTALADRMDPEDYREVLGAYQSAAVQSIERYDGYVARYMGDGLLAYFGYPQAHEEDAERAVHAGLGIVERVSALTPRKELTLQVRIGIATGRVVVGDIVGEGASEEHAVLGETPNLLRGVLGTTAVLTSGVTPLDDEHLIVRAAYRIAASGPLSGLWVRLFAHMSHQVFSEDIPIWEHKIRPERPVFSESDRTVLQFQRWLARFPVVGED